VQRDVAKTQEIVRRIAKCGADERGPMSRGLGRHTLQELGVPIPADRHGLVQHGQKPFQKGFERRVA
jgi:hypothetical protein